VARACECPSYGSRMRWATWADKERNVAAPVLSCNASIRVLTINFRAHDGIWWLTTPAGLRCGWLRFSITAMLLPADLGERSMPLDHPTGRLMETERIMRAELAVSWTVSGIMPLDRITPDLDDERARCGGRSEQPGMCRLLELCHGHAGPIAEIQIEFFEA